MPRDILEKNTTNCNLWNSWNGNLPKFKAHDNWCNIPEPLQYGTTAGTATVMPGVKISDFRAYHIECPYSESALVNFVREATVSEGALTYNMRELTAGELSVHTATSGTMIRETRGSKHGWLCVDNNCSYYISTGNRYFYI